MGTTPSRRPAAKRATPAARKAAAPAKHPQPEPEPQPQQALTVSDREWLDRQQALASGGAVAAQAETLLEDIPDGAVAVPLGPHGDLVHVIPRGQWRASALSMLNEGDLDGWARMCLHKPDYDVWVGVDPTVDEVMEMFEAWQKLTGEDLGKANAQRGSLRNGRRR
jgi:hypothetical protein